MRGKTARTLIVAFIALLLLQSVISIFVYDAKLHTIRSKVKSEILDKLEDSELALIKVAKALEQQPNESFKRIDNKEVQFLGEMYDIVSTRDAGDTTYYYCYHDKDESDIIRKIDSWLTDNFGSGSSKDGKQEENTGQDFIEKYCCDVSVFNSIQGITIENYICASDSKLYIGFLSSFSPPPEVIS